MKHFTMIELIAVMALTALLASMVLSMNNINNQVTVTQIELGTMIEKAKMANTITRLDSVIAYDGRTFTIKYYEHNNAGVPILHTKTHDVGKVTVQIFQGGQALSEFRFRDFEVFPGGGEIRIEISTPEDKGVIIRVNTFTGKVSYYESAKL